MPSWFIDQLIVLLSFAIPVVIVCGIAGFIGSAGYCLRRGLLHARVGQQGAAWKRWIYSVIVLVICILFLIKLQSDWAPWLLVIGLYVAGYFGYFLVPGHNDASHH
jgi:hypothetical protein